MQLWDGLTWFLCGGVDGRRLWPGASRIESGHREVVHCVRFQAGDVNQCVVPRNAHFANGVGLGVVLPIHNLLCNRKQAATFSGRGRGVRDKKPDGGAFHCIIQIHICCLFYKMWRERRGGGRER